MSLTPVPIGNDVLVNTYTTDIQREPSVTALADGGFVVTWTSEGQDGSGWGIYGQRYAADGTVIGSEFGVNSYTTDIQWTSSVTGLADGGFVVTWMSSGQDGSINGIYGQRYAADGTPVGGEFRANSYTTDIQWHPSVAALADGGFVVTWSSLGQDGDGYGIYGQRYATDGTPIGGEFRANSYTTGDQLRSMATSLTDGGFVVTWTSNGQDGSDFGVYGQRYAASGTPLGGEFRVNSYTTFNQMWSSATALAGGGFVVTWTSVDQDGSLPGIYGQRYAQDGTPVDGEFKANSHTFSHQVYPSTTALSDGGFVVTWSSSLQDGDGYGIYGQRYAADGTAIGDEFRVNQITAGDQLAPASYGSELLATLADGRLVQVWTEGQGDVSLRLIGVPALVDLTPAPTGDDIQVNSYTTGSQLHPTVTALAAGGFVVAWESLGEDGSGFGIYAQRYSSTFVPQGGAFQVNTETADTQEFPATAALSEGGFVVTWSSAQQDGSSWGIYGQRFADDGSPIGDEFRVNTDTVGSQRSSSIAALSDGGFVVVWSSQFQATFTFWGWAILGQRYAADGSAVGSEFYAAGQMAFDQLYPTVIGLNDGGFLVTCSVFAGGFGSEFRRYAADGSLIANGGLGSSAAPGNRKDPAAAALADGGFVVTWSSNQQTLSDSDIYGQKYAADGSLTGSEFRINTRTFSDQDFSSVTALPDGGFVVTWSSIDQDGSGYGIYGQRYAADGAPVGSEFSVNQITLGSQTTGDNEGSFLFTSGTSTIATLGDGQLVQVWSGLGLEEVFFRLIDIPTAANAYTVTPSTTVPNEGATITFTITRSGDLSAETVYASTIHGAANGYSVNAGDYATNVNNLPVLFAQGQISATVTVAVTDDTAVEADETFGFIVQLSPSDPVTTFLAQTNWTIHDNDEPATAYSITPNPGAVSESAGSLVFTLSRSGILDAETLYVSTVNGAANGYSTNSGDYATNINNLPVSFASGQASQPVTVTILNDATAEAWETFGLIAQRNATDVPGIYLAKSTFTIQDDDGGATTGWSVSPQTSSFDESAGSRTFTVTRANTSQAITVYVSTVQTEGFFNSGDYGGIANYALSFAVGETSQPVMVSIIDDAMVEGNETFGLIVQQSDHDPSATYLAKSTFTILDNDQSQAPLSVSLSADISVSENDGFAVLTASLDRPASQTVSVFYSTVAGTASAAERDYEGVIDQKIIFNPGEQTQQVKVHLLNDERLETTEFFDVMLKNPQGMTLSRDLARITITDDETIVAPAARQTSAEFMAILASAAYYAPPGTNDIATLLFGELPSRYGFRFLTTVDLPALLPVSPTLGLVEDGLFVNSNAAALIGTVGDALYIAFRGTDDAADVIQWVNKEAHYALFNDDVSGANFSKAILDYLNAHSDIRQVYVTGHSLGGAMAQALMVDKDGPAYLASPNFHAITFASPGYGPGIDVPDSRIINIYEEFDAIRAAEFVSKTAGSDFIIHDSSLWSGFTPIELHDMSLYLKIAEKLNEANIDIERRSWLDYVTFQKKHINLDIDRDVLDLDGNGNPWIVNLPSVASNLLTEVKNVILAPTAADEVFVGAVGEGYYPLYYTGHLIQSAVVNLAKGVAEGIGVGVDKLIDVLSVVTGPGDDTIIGNAFGNAIEAGAGADLVFGLLGDDWLIGGSGEGDDLYDGGEDMDTVVYASTTQGIYVNLAASSNHAIGPEIGTDQIIDVENVIGGSGIDTLIGNGFANMLDGGPAADYLLGGMGDDLYKVDDTFDLVDEGGAFPTFAGSALDFDTISSTAEWFWDVYSVGERLQLEEGAAGSDGAGSTIVGSVFSNEMIGNSGTNIMFGRGGADTYRAGDGVDWISLDLLGVTNENAYPGVDGVNTIIVEQRTTGDFSYDIIFALEVGKDKIDVSDYGYATATEVLLRGHDDGFGNSYYALGDGLDYVYLVGVTTAQVTFTDFVV